MQLEPLAAWTSRTKDTLIYLVAIHALLNNPSEANKTLTQLFAIDPELSIDEIADSHAWLSADTLGLLLEGISLAMSSCEPENLRLVEN